MHDLLTVILLGILEGLTEFLPVSSTGHLILAGELLGFTGEGSATFKIAIQLGAILAVIVVYWRRFWDVGMGLIAWRRPDVMFTRNILLGFAPALVIGVLVYDAVRAALERPVIVAVALIVGGVLILAIERMVKRVRFEAVEAMPFGTALSIGIVQCLAMLPGVSRSGATIMGARTLGVDRAVAAEYSFFLAVPTMAGATALALYKAGPDLGGASLTSIAIGFFVSFVVAMLVIRWFVGIVARHGFAPFAWYRIVAGSVALMAYWTV